MEVFCNAEMIAAGIEAMRAAQRERLTEGETAVEVYLAMYLTGVKAMGEKEETVH